MSDMHTRALEVAEELICTSKDLVELTTENERNSTIFTRTLDEQVSCCDCCGWWFAADEIDDDGNCEDCASDV